MKIILPVFCLSALISLVSCQKEISGDFLGSETPPNGLLGHWKFINTQVSTNVTVEIVDEFSDVKNVSTSDYTSLNNMGDVVIDDSVMTSTAISYEISTTVKAYTYQNGNLEDSSELPFNLSFPAADSRIGYKLVGTDSIAVTGDALNQVSGTPAGMQTSGYKYQLAGDTLKLIGGFDQSSTDNSMGVPITTSNKASLITTLARQ